MSRPVIIKVYAALHPTGQDAFHAVQQVLESWHIMDAVELVGDMLRISFEGDYFPQDDVLDALTPFLSEESRGKFDYIDMEEWMLHRCLFDYGRLVRRSASLNHALESCSRPL